MCVSLSSTYGQATYKDMMYDNTINFYDVVDAAEAYFTINEKGKGSDWKGYQRWKEENESKYYPTGNRYNNDPLQAKNAIKRFLRGNPSAEQRNIFDNEWIEQGPLRIDSITSHYSAGLGRIEDIYVDPNNANDIYVGSRSGGFWKTEDAGSSWQGGSTDFLFATGVNTLTVSPTNKDSILINIRNASNKYSHGVYRSTDAGDTWVETDFNPTNIGVGGLGSTFKIFAIRYHPHISDLIFIGTNEGVYRSADNLTTWSLLLPFSDITEIQFHPTDSDIIYLYDANQPNIVLRSTDQGLTFATSNVLNGNNGNASVHLSVSDDCADCLYCASSNGVWRSTDKGINFTFLTNPIQSCHGFSVNDQDTSYMIYGYVDITRSTDGGKTFTKCTYWSLGNTNGDHTTHQKSFETSTNYVHADLHPAKCINGVFYVGTDGLISKSTDNGVTWEGIGQGIGVRENYRLGVSQSNHYRSISGSQDNGTSIKVKDTWIEFYGADGMEGIIHPLNDSWMIGSTQNGGRRVTYNTGKTNQSGNPSGSENGAWIAPIAYDPNNHMTVYDFRENIYKSTNFGDTHQNLGTPSGFNGTIKRAAIAQNNSDIIVVSRYSQILKSTDGAVSFSSINNNLPDHSIKDLAFDPNDDNTIIIVFNSSEDNDEKVFITTNGGTSWTNITHNLGNMPILSVVIDHTNASNIYLGAEIGIYTMPMTSNNWDLYNTNLPNVSVKEMEIVYGSNTIKAATWGRGLWEYSLIGRETYPRILTTKIKDLPTLTTPNENSIQYVTSVVSYDDDISEVFVQWSSDTPSFNNTIPMQNATDSIWISDSPLPIFIAGTKLYFKVLAVGSNQDTTETYKFMYEIRDPLDSVFCQELNDKNDDVEEYEDGSISKSSSDLELCYDGESQYIGLNFKNVLIPINSSIVDAYIEFQADEDDNGTLDINIAAVNHSNTYSWNSGNSFDVSTKPRTNANVVWSHDATTAWEVV